MFTQPYFLSSLCLHIQTVRVWSASTLRCLEEYKVAELKSSKGLKSPVVDLDFDENKVRLQAALQRRGGHCQVH